MRIAREGSLKCRDPKGFGQEVDLIEVAGLLLPLKCVLTCLPLGSTGGFPDLLQVLAKAQPHLFPVVVWPP